ncbi:rho GTPase-activating protein 20-like, partial [Ochotona curzoniae]|uniref:rho GTPase-activating protein 20-like n=1 Tax=Ochotona curzoniae TaxID=130825 RepID=UPI001B3490CA
LKEKLNSGEHVDWETTCPVLVATVLKDLLQNIPGSVLTANLYEKFIDVLDEGNEEAKIAMILRLLQQLPKPNVHLLQSLFRCLCKISQNSPSKEMTSSNLAWCITPSLLQPPIASILDKGTEWKKKVAFVQFLLDHCFKIFGDDFTPTIRDNVTHMDHNLEASDATNLFHLFYIQDMFSCIDSKGQYTEGIFKTRVNGQAYRALKEKLNSREHVDWTSESPYVVATVLKDFLQSIPGSLFTTSLYEEFIDALDEGNNEARTATICRLLDQLPKLNFHLLESLFLCLHKIAYSPLSKMTSFDLALCLTPSLLWLPISGSSGRGMEWQRKVTLVQYLIENYTRIFGHKLSSPMGEDIENQDNVQDTSGIIMTH